MFDNSNKPFVFEENKNNKPKNFSNRNPRRSSAAREGPSDQTANGLLMMAGSNITSR